MRLAPITGLTGALLDFSTSDDYPTTGFTNGNSSPYTPGAIVIAGPTDGIDTTAGVPNWVHSEIMYVFNSGAAVLPGALVTLDKDLNITAAASTANLGNPTFVALTSFSAGSTTRQGGWVMLSGVAPVKFSVAATTGAVFLGTAGAATPTAAAGKQLLNAQTIGAAATAFTRQIRTVNGSKQIQCSRVNGIFLGQAVTGTGVGASAVVTSIDPSGTAFNVDVASSASGSVTGTFTPTGYGIVRFDRMFSQGQTT